MNKILAYQETEDYSSIDWDSDSEMVPNIFDNFKIKTKYGALAATATPFVVFGSVYIAWAYLIRAWQRKKDKQHPRVLKRSMSIGALHGGKLALQRLKMYHEARANNETLNIAECELKILLANQDTPDFWELQTTIAKLEMSGKEDQAVNILRNAKERADDEERVHEAYEIEMLLVEMLIYKGDFREAFECKCLNDEKITDARRPLYKAIIHIMLDEDKATECWQEFNNITEHFPCPPSFRESMQEIGIQDLSTKFDDFKKVVQTLKDDIEKAKEKKVKK